MAHIRTIHLYFIGIVTLVGAIYSGYLAYNKLVLDVCVGAPCPMLFGVPVCVYGFAAFSLLFLATVIMYFFRRKAQERMVDVIFWISLAGVLFSLYYLILELFLLPCPAGGCKISLVYPSCLYGLAMFGLIFHSSRRLWKKEE